MNRQDSAQPGWWASGAPGIWLTASAVAISLLAALGVMLLLAVKGLAFFWQADLVEVEWVSAPGEAPQRFAGELVGSETLSAVRAQMLGQSIPEGQTLVRHQLKVGNRELSGRDFRWLTGQLEEHLRWPAGLTVLERLERGNFYGYWLRLLRDGEVVVSADSSDVGDPLSWRVLQDALDRQSVLRRQALELRNGKIGEVLHALERLENRRASWAWRNQLDEAREAELQRRHDAIMDRYTRLERQLFAVEDELKRDRIVMRTASGQEVEMPLAQVLRALRPNTMGVMAKSWLYLQRIWEFLSSYPREANTEGGVFPAIFGTALLVLLLSIFVTPLGVVTAVYMHEYASDGLVSRLVRIAVNNLAGVPSVVYGIFGLGLFVYAIGGSIDALLFPERLPRPTFGTGGLLWASLTLALLTMPVVIVATEEGLTRIPRSIREGSLALGATRLETLWRLTLPIASPAMITGLILAIARAAGEVAPLMLVGVVKLAPSLPLDGHFPFLHLDRKFMHLGFHIYDLGFQSPNVESSRPLVYATALLLVIIVVVLNMVAIMVRNRLWARYRTMDT